MSDLRLEDLRVFRVECDGCGFPEDRCLNAPMQGYIKCCPDCRHDRPASEPEVLSLFTDADLLGELVRRGQGRFTKTANGRWFKMWIGDVSE